MTPERLQEIRAMDARFQSDYSPSWGMKLGATVHDLLAHIDALTAREAAAVAAAEARAVKAQCPNLCGKGHAPELNTHWGWPAWLHRTDPLTLHGCMADAIWKAVTDPAAVAAVLAGERGE